jgi:hypothetical protein
MRWVALGLIGLGAIIVCSAPFIGLDPMIVLTACLVVLGAIQWMLVDGQDEHFTNSERAWVLVDLRWDSGHADIINSDTQVPLVTQTTWVHLRLTCRNEGRSPAWIDKVSTQMAVVSEVGLSRTVTKAKLKHCDAMEALGANKEGSQILELDCDGHMGQTNFLSVYVVVDYHDIFEIKRQTTVGYSINHLRCLRRLVEFPELNQNS